MKLHYDSFHFDMDGVIANTEPLHVQAEKDTCRHFGLDVDLEGWGGFKGRTAEDIFGHLRATHVSRHGERDAPLVGELVEYKTNLLVNSIFENGVEPIDGAIELIKYLYMKADASTVVTSSKRRIKNEILGYLDLQKYFRATVDGDEVVNGKPHPEPYLTAKQKLGKLGLQSERSLVFEDSTAGIASALGARCAVMAITSSHPRDVLEMAQPSFIVDSFYEAPDIITA